MKELRDASLTLPHDFWKEDRYSFSVLARILKFRCVAIFTDEKTFVICHSEAPYPVWIWTRDGTDDALYAFVWEIVGKKFPPARGYRYNLKYDAAKALRALAQKDGVTIETLTNMTTYECATLLAPKTRIGGALHVCEAADVSTAKEFFLAFQKETGAEETTDAFRETEARALTADGRLFFWKTDDQRAVAMCGYRVDEGFGAVSYVYTAPDVRRQNYASHLVYDVTRRVIEEGLTPILYTDTDYEASNACYQKLGYEARGILCTIGVKTARKK